MLIKNSRNTEAVKKWEGIRMLHLSAFASVVSFVATKWRP